MSSGSKDLVDMIKLVAYRAETAMAQVVREALPKWRREEERRLLQSLYASEADLIPDLEARTLRVRVHFPANPMLGRAVDRFCAELAATETVFPTTELRLVYELAGGESSRALGTQTGEFEQTPPPRDHWPRCAAAWISPMGPSNWGSSQFLRDQEL